MAPSGVADLSHAGAGLRWARTRLCDRIDAVITHEDADSLTRDHDIAEAVAPDTALPPAQELS